MSNKQPFFGNVCFRRCLTTEEYLTVKAILQKTRHVLKHTVEVDNWMSEFNWTATACVCKPVKAELEKLFKGEDIIYPFDDPTYGWCEPGDPADLM